MWRAALITLVALVVIVVAIVGWAVGINNQLVRLEQDVNETWAQVQNVYQRRADLIPNLVETVRGFAAQERTVLEEVTKARASASSIQLTPEALNDPKALERFQAAQRELGGALSRLLVTVGALSRAQVEPELPGPAVPAGGHREPHRGGAAAVQRSRAGLQHPAAPVSRQHDRQPDGLPAQGVLRSGPRCSNTPEGEVLVCFRLFCSPSPSLIPPAPTARVNDYAGLLAAADRARLEALLTERERATGAQMVIAIFRSLEGESLEDFSIRLAERWRVGQRGLDNGVILLVFLDDRRVRLEVGYGLEPVLPDAVASRIISG